MIVLKGAEVSARIKEEVHKILAGWEKEAPKLAIVRVGETRMICPTSGEQRKSWKALA